MAGSRLHKHGTIFKRMQGLMKSEAVKWEDRPVWYDVMERFPPKVEPSLDRPLPNTEVRKILYPEDFIRAKVYETYDCASTTVLNKNTEASKTIQQKFVEEYIKSQRKGATLDEVFVDVEQKMQEQGIKMERKVQQKKVVVVEETEEVHYDPVKF